MDIAPYGYASDESLEHIEECPEPVHAEQQQEAAPMDTAEESLEYAEDCPETGHGLYRQALAKQMRIDLGESDEQLTTQERRVLAPRWDGLDMLLEWIMDAWADVPARDIPQYILGWMDCLFCATGETSRNLIYLRPPADGKDKEHYAGRRWVCRKLSELRTKAGEQEVEEQKAQRKHLALPLQDLDLSTRTFNCLWKSNIKTLGDLAKCDEAGLLRIRDFGRRSLEEVHDKLDEFDLALSPDGKVEHNFLFPSRGGCPDGDPHH